MRVKQVRVAIGATINLGNYENVKPTAEVLIEIDEAKGETAEQAFAAGWEITQEQIRSQWRSLRKANQ